MLFDRHASLSRRNNTGATVFVDGVPSKAVRRQRRRLDVRRGWFTNRDGVVQSNLIPQGFTLPGSQNPRKR